jgi:hypothetical protein
MDNPFQDGRHPINELLSEIGLSMVLMAALTATADIKYDGQKELIAHAQERISFIDMGFGIYRYYDDIPFLFCIEEGGTTDMTESRSGLFGPIKHT